MAITLTEEITEAPRRGRGALPKADPTVWEKVGLSETEWARAKLYRPGGKPTDIVREMLDTCKLFRPEGKPATARKAPGTRLSASVGRAAAQRGMEKAAYINAACAAFEAARKGDE